MNAFLKGIQFSRLTATAIGLSVVAGLYTEANAGTIAYNNIVASDSPVAYYQFEGNFQDSAGSNNLTPAGNWAIVNDPSNPSSSMALSLGAGAASADVADGGVGSALDVTSLTVSGFFNWTGASGTNMILNKESAYEVAIVNGQLWGAVETVGGGGWFWVNSGATLTANTWYYFAMTYDETTSRQEFYLNGAGGLIGATLPAGGIVDTSGPLHLGGRGSSIPANGSFFSGQLDQISVFGSALSASRIEQHYSALISPDVAPVPLPASFPLLLAGLGAIGLMRRKKS